MNIYNLWTKGFNLIYGNEIFRCGKMLLRVWKRKVGKFSWGWNINPLIYDLLKRRSLRRHIIPIIESLMINRVTKRDPWNSRFIVGTWLSGFDYPPHLTLVDRWLEMEKIVIPIANMWLWYGRAMKSIPSWPCLNSVLDNLILIWLLIRIWN